jgi:transcriptional regulator with XRE-family HTH domain
MKTITRVTPSIRSVLTDKDRLRAVGLEIRRQRKIKGLSQGRLAALIGKSTATVSKIESGAQPVDMGTFLNIAGRLNVAPEVVLLRAQMAQKPQSDVQSRVLEVFRQTMELLGT